MTYPSSPQPEWPPPEPLPPPVDPFTDPVLPPPTRDPGAPSPWAPDATSPQFRADTTHPGIGTERITEPLPTYRPGVATAPQPPTRTTRDDYPPTAEWPSYATRPSRPRRPAKLIGVAIGLVAAVLACGGLITAGLITANGGKVGALPTQPAPRPKPTTAAPTRRADTASIVYEVTGDGPATITYLKNAADVVDDPKKSSEIVSNVRLPWRVRLSVDRPALVESLIASRVGLDEGSLTCRILVDGTEVARKTATGKLATAVCFNVL